MKRKLLVIDFETGGLNPETDALCSLAAVVLNEGFIDEVYYSLIRDHDGNLDPEAMAVNGPGTAIVGTNYGYGIVQSGWIWQQGKGTTAIVEGPFRVIPTAVSDDGRTAVGNVIVTSGGDRRAFVWTEGKGVTFLDDLLKSKGGSLAAGWQIQSLNAMSADGQIIGGWGINPNGEIEGFLVDLKETGKP